MPSINIETTSVTAGGKDVDLSTLHPKALNAVIRRGLTHLFGSEISSKVIARKAAFAEESKREMTDDEVAEAKASLVAAMHAKLVDGTLGDRAVGQSVDPVDALMESKARNEIKEMLRANGIKVPKKDEVIETGDGNKFTLDDLVARRLGNEDHKARLEKEAKKDIAAKDKAKKALVVEGAKNVVDLGL